MRHLFLGRGANDEVQKGTTGNTILVAQPSPRYEQVLGNYLSKVADKLEGAA